MGFCFLGLITLSPALRIDLRVTLAQHSPVRIWFGTGGRGHRCSGAIRAGKKGNNAPAPLRRSMAMSRFKAIHCVYHHFQAG